jgi:phosphatidylglycerol:prolipoprotein diacylglycerol transferase
VHPLLHVAGLELPAYRVLTAAALVSGAGVALLTATRLGIPFRRALGVGTAALAGGLVGGRLFAAVTAADPFWGDAGTVFQLRFGNMAMFGGLLGATATGVWAARALGVAPARFGDAAAPAIGVGIVLLRLGCLLAGCCFGRETALPWGITYPIGSPAHFHQIASDGSVLAVLHGTEPVHPIPVYEMTAGVLLVVGTIWVIRRGVRDGTALAVVAAGYGSVRLVIEPLRAPEAGITPAWFDPVLFAGCALVAIGWMIVPNLIRRWEPGWLTKPA